jgi:hypothetical protein
MAILIGVWGTPLVLWQELVHHSQIRTLPVEAQEGSL